MTAGFYKSSKIVLLALALGLSASAVEAQDATAIVKQRQDIMGGLFRNYYRDFSQVARGESTDLSGIPAKSQQAVADLQKFGTLFPAGTGRDVDPKTRAKPEIWTQRSAFDAALTKLITETQKLGETAKAGNVDAVKTQYAVVADACGGCHGGPGKSGGTFRFEAQ